MPRFSPLANATLLLAIAFAGCNHDSQSSSDLGIGYPAADGGVVGAVSYTDGGDFCTGSGPIVLVGDGQTTTPAPLCAGQLAQAIFQNALCTCNNAELAGYLLTRGMNSANPMDPSMYGAPVGVNNDYAVSAGYTDVGGSMSVAGANSLSLVGYVAVHGDLRLEGQALIPGYTNVARNAWFGGAFTDLGPLDVGGDLHQATAVTALPLTVTGKKIQAPVTIPPPCDCAPKDLLDVGSLVDAAKVTNDNATINLSPTALDGTFGKAEITLPCGRFFLDKISGLAEIIVHVTGRVALFIDSDIDATGILNFDLSPTAEIDIFIRGNLALTGSGSFGDKSHPAGTRIYVGGSNDVTLIGAAGFVGNLYAPHAKVTAVGYAEVWGSVFADNFTVPGYTHIIFDRAITMAGKNCGGPPQVACNLCGVCQSGLACVEGMCVDCKTDADCCGQQACNNGFCGPLIQ